MRERRLPEQRPAIPPAPLPRGNQRYIRAVVADEGVFAGGQLDAEPCAERRARIASDLKSEIERRVAKSFVAFELVQHHHAVACVSECEPVLRQHRSRAFRQTESIVPVVDEAVEGAWADVA